LNGDHKRKSGYPFPLALMIWSMGAVLSLLVSPQTPVNAASISGESNTIFRMMKSTSDKNLYPLFEYLRFSGTDNVGDYGSVALNMGGWGRVDLGDNSFYNTDKQDGDLQYGYLSYRSNKNNLLFNAGRQFVAEGVTADRLDGLYFRSDLAAGFGAAAYVGSPVVLEPNYKGGDLIYGGRITQSNPKYYSLGISALRTDQNGSRLREEQGVDLWLHPLKQIDVVGKSSYNSITSGWMNHDYVITFNLLESLSFSGNGSYISYKDYFYQVTTNALSLTPNGQLNPNEKVLTLGGSIDFSPVKYFRLTADYKNYDYDIAGQAQYYGGKATFSLPDSFVAGFSIHRMNGETDTLRYDKYRLFAQKKLGKADLTVDFFNVNYQSAINGIKNTYSVTGAAAYDITENFRVAVDVNYLQDTLFDNAVTGLVKVTYSFDKKLGAEGRAKSEK